jgi:hypothetical protein
MRLGFKVMLDTPYAPLETAGYLPCTLDGEVAGFGMRFQDIAADLSPALKAGAGRDAAIGFCWSGDPREQLAALRVRAALVKQFGAVVHEPNKDALLSLDRLMAKACHIEASLKRREEQD